MANDFVQTMIDAGLDARSLSDFMFYPASAMISRRLAPSIHTLNYYLDYFNGLELLYSQESGTVTVNGVEIKTVRQAMTDAIDDVLLGEYQEGMRADLNAQKLDTGITATAKFGGVERTQADKNSDSVHVADFGAVGIGDETAKIQAAINANNTVDFGDKGIVYTVSNLKLKDGSHLKGSATLDFSGNANYSNTTSNPLILAKGASGTPILLTESLVKGSRTINVGNTSGLLAGDIIEIATPTHSGDYIDTSATVINGELVKIESITSSTQIELSEPVVEEYGYATTNGAQIRKINTVNITIDKGIKILGKGRATSGSGDFGLVIFYGRDCVVKADFTDVDFNAIKLEACYNSKVSEGVYKVAKKGDNTYLNYGVVVSGSSKHTKVFNCDFFNMRHSVVTSHVSAPAENLFGVSRFLSVFENRFYNTWHAAVSTHNDADQIDIYNNHFFGCYIGVNTRERNVRIYSNIFVDSGTGVYLSSHPKNITIKGNTCVSQQGGNFIYAKFDADSAISDIKIIDNNIDSLNLATAINIFNDTGVTNKGLVIKGNMIKDAIGVGGAGAMIRVSGTPITNAEISDNRITDYSKTVAMNIASGGDNVLVKGNHVDYGVEKAYLFLGVFTKTYVIHNTAKGDVGGTVIQGSKNITNASTVNQDNTWY